MKVFHYPVANESIHPEDPYEPNYFSSKHKALGDEATHCKNVVRKERTLQEITERLQLGKSTVHHHLKLLRAAKLWIYMMKYVLRKESSTIVSERIRCVLNR